MYYVYAYCDPSTKFPFYIGKGKGRRDKQHLGLCHTGGSHFYHKLNKMLREGIEPQIVHIFEGGERACLQVEQTCIGSYGRTCDGGILCNVSEGGNQPPSWAGKRHSRTTRDKMAAVPRTQEWRDRIGLANKGRYVSDNTRKAVSEANSKPIAAFDLETGEVVHKFAKQVDVLVAGFNRNCVGRVANGYLKSHKGLGWRHEE